MKRILSILVALLLILCLLVPVMALSFVPGTPIITTWLPSLTFVRAGDTLVLEIEAGFCGNYEGSELNYAWYIDHNPTPIATEARIELDTADLELNRWCFIVRYVAVLVTVENTFVDGDGETQIARISQTGYIVVTRCGVPNWLQNPIRTVFHFFRAERWAFWRPRVA